MEQEKKLNLSQRLPFVMGMMAVGGAMDAYSYVVRGGVFATGQTGNFTLVAIHLIQGNFRQMLQVLLSVIAFWIGVFVCWHVFYRGTNQQEEVWQKAILVLEFVIIGIVGFIPGTCSNYIVNPLIAIAAAMQFCAFRKVGEKDGYASIFCTGNMRSCAENYYKAIMRKDRVALHKAYIYTAILLAFFGGAALMAIMCGLMNEKAILGINIILLGLYIASVWMSEKKANKQIVKEA